MNAEQTNRTASPPSVLRRWGTSAARALGFGVAIFVAVFLIAAALSLLSFATGHKEPMGLLGLILRTGEFIYSLPVCWLSPPYTPTKNLIEIAIQIAFWGLCAEAVFSYFRHERSSNKKNKVAS